jgi:hypothetical protein
MPYPPYYPNMPFYPPMPDAFSMQQMLQMQQNGQQPSGGSYETGGECAKCPISQLCRPAERCCRHTADKNQYGSGYERSIEHFGLKSAKQREKSRTSWILPKEPS